MNTLDISKIQTGDTGLCEGTSELAKTIQHSTNSKFSHTCQFFWLHGVLYVIDAQKDGVSPQTYKSWQREYGYKVTIYRNPNCLAENRWISNAMQYSRVKYDKKGLIVGLIKSKTLWFWKKKDMDDKYRNNGLFWCSEYTMKLIGVENPEDYSPQGVYEYCLKNNFLKIEV